MKVVAILAVLSGAAQLWGFSQIHSSTTTERGPVAQETCK